MTIADALTEHHQARYTGPMVLHWAQGVVVQIEIPGEPTRIRLDTGAKTRRLDRQDHARTRA